MKDIQLQKRHFEWIASVIREIPYTVQRQEIAILFARHLGATNRDFNYDRFIDAATRRGKGNEDA